MSDYSFWSSSPNPDDAYGSWGLDLDADSVDPDNYYYRVSNRRVRCLRNSIVEPAPQTFIINFFDDSVEVAS